jgi:hypothetical protein
MGWLRAFADGARVATTRRRRPCRCTAHASSLLFWIYSQKGNEQ